MTFMVPLGTFPMPSNSAGLTHGEEMYELQESRGGCKGLWWGAWPHGLGGQGASQAYPPTTVK